jgi:hypothetical protein
MSRTDLRTAIKQLLAGAASLAVAPRFLLFAAPLPQQERPTAEEHREMAAVAKFMDQFFAPVLSVAILRNGAFVFERPFGMADKEVGAANLADDVVSYCECHQAVSFGGDTIKDNYPVMGKESEFHAEQTTTQ